MAILHLQGNVSLEDNRIHEGEREVIRILEKGLPDPATHVFVSARITNVEDNTHHTDPDIVIWMPQIGLLFIEVKDHSQEDMGFAAHAKDQVRHYVNNAMTYLKRSKILAPNGDLLFPIGQCVVWTHLDSEAVQHLNDIVFDAKCISYSIDELRYSTPEEIVKTFRECMPFAIDHKSITRSLVKELNRRLDPTTMAGNLRPRQLTRTQGSRKTRIVESNEQIRIRLDGDNRILISGPPGSGKTISLLTRADDFLRTTTIANPRILVTCWNKMLCNETYDLFYSFHLPRPDPRVIISPFASWVRKEILRMQSDEVELPAEMVKSAIQHIKERAELRYDAIFVDEAQIFSEEWFEVLLLSLVDPKRSSVTACFGEGQTARVTKGREAELQATADSLVSKYGFTREYLPKVFRCTKKLAIFARAFVSEIGIPHSDDYEVDSNQVMGSWPSITRIDDYAEALFTSLESRIDEYLQYGYRPDDILVTSFTKEPLAYLAKKRSNFGFQYKIQSRASGCVTLATHLSIAGIERRIVFALNCEHYYSSRESLFGVITRASEELVILYVDKHGLIQDLLDLKMRLESRYSN